MAPLAARAAHQRALLAGAAGTAAGGAAASPARQAACRASSWRMTASRSPRRAALAAAASARACRSRQARLRGKRGWLAMPVEGIHQILLPSRCLLGRLCCAGGAPPGAPAVRGPARGRPGRARGAAGRLQGGCMAHLRRGQPQPQVQRSLLACAQRRLQLHRHARAPGRARRGAAAGAVAVGPAAAAGAGRRGGAPVRGSSGPVALAGAAARAARGAVEPGVGAWRRRASALHFSPACLAAEARRAARSAGLAGAGDPRAPRAYRSWGLCGAGRATLQAGAAAGGRARPLWRPAPRKRVRRVTGWPSRKRKVRTGQQARLARERLQSDTGTWRVQDPCRQAGARQDEPGASPTGRCVKAACQGGASGTG